MLWQLDTSKKQFLPHLSSAIESLVVSPRGSSYALRLADNSAMVLSTSELKPTASIAGIQCRSKTHSCVPQPRTKTVNSSMAERLDHPSSRPIQTPSAVNPLNPSQLLLAVAPSQPTYSESAATNRIVFLQTFDFGTTQHVSRQALARTNTTALNIGPDGGKIGEPDVKYMRVSHDGQWLATVDEWSLPSKDIEFLSLDERPSEEEQQRRLEVFLKFWLWNAEAKEWQLVTRVDSPHALTSVDESGAGGVLTFVADPSALGFASLGEDGVVRFWRPKIRRRNGIEIRGKNAEVLISWHCQHVVQLESTSQQRKLAGASPRASMAFSEDGSLLAVSQQCSSADRHGVVHFIDTASGRIRQSRAGLYAGDLIDMGIVDRYLIILSEQLNVWDMVDDELHFGLSLQSYRFSSQERAATTHLTVDQRHHTFAIALPVIGNEKHKSWFQSAKRSQSQIAVFDPSQPTPLYTTLLPHMITSLLPAVGSKGYIILDSAAEVCILSPKSVPFMSNVALAAGSTEPLVGLENVYGRSKTHAENSKNDGNDLSEDESDAVTPPFASAEPPTEIYDDDEPVVSQQQLAGIFDVGSAFAMPPIDELFERVAGLFAKKPRSLG